LANKKINMAETLEQTADSEIDKAIGAKADSAPSDSSSPPSAAPVAAAQGSSNQAEDSPDDDLGVLIQKVKTTISTSLDDQSFDKELRKHIKKIKGWEAWSEHAKSAFAHMWAAQLLHNKAVDIKKDNKMDFTPVTGDSYKKLVRSLTHRVRF
jgi:hypothetical protein